MKLQHLEYVIAIAQAGSITGAAKKLYQAQPNISIALKELEAQLGIQIFWRTPNGMILTPEGEEFFLRAKKNRKRSSRTRVRVYRQDRVHGIL